MLVCLPSKYWHNRYSFFFRNLSTFFLKIMKWWILTKYWIKFDWNIVPKKKESHLVLAIIRNYFFLVFSLFSWSGSFEMNYCYRWKPMNNAENIKDPELIRNFIPFTDHKLVHNKIFFYMFIILLITRHLWCWTQKVFFH